MDRNTQTGTRFANVPCIPRKFLRKVNHFQYLTRFCTSIDVLYIILNYGGDSIMIFQISLITVSSSQIKKDGTNIFVSLLQYDVFLANLMQNVICDMEKEILRNL